MPSKKISQLSSAAPLAGTEVLPGLQSGGDVGITPAMLAAYVGTVLNAANFPGATAGDKITAALAALPAAGGTVDARGITNRTINGFTISTSNTTVLFPPGEFSLTAPIVITNSAGISSVKLIGAGGTELPSGTGFTNNNSSTSPMIILAGARSCTLSDFYIRATNNNVANAGIQCQTLTGPTFRPTDNRFRNITMFGAGAGGLSIGLQKGIRFCTGTQAGIIGPGTDGNNDVNYMENVRVLNYGQTAFSLEHPQCKTNIFINCSFNAGQIGVNTSGDSFSFGTAWSGGGSFKWFGGSGGACSDADFKLTSNDYTLIQGWNSENSNRFMTTPGGLSIPGSINIISCRVACDNLNADNQVIHHAFQGGLLVMGCEFDSTKVGAAPKFTQTNPTNLVYGSTAIGNSFTWNTGSTGIPFEGRWNTMANWCVDSGSDSVFRVPDTAPLAAAPATVSAATYSQTGFEGTIIFTGTGTTMTLLGVATVPGLKVRLLTTAAHAVISAASNVVPLVGGAAGTAILSGSAGKWADLECDGSNWIITAAN